MSETPWVKFYASDWLAGTSGLTSAERGVYITLIALIYENEGPIAYDEARLARRCGCPKAAFAKAFRGLCSEGKMALADGMVSNRRTEKELSARGIRAQKASASANARWRAQADKTEQNQSSENANASAKQCLGDAIQKPEPEEKEEPIGSSQKSDPFDADQPAELTGADDPSGPHTIPQPVGPPPKRRAVSLPANWVPSDRNIADAAERNFSAEEIQHEADRFRDYHLAHGTTFKDWDAGWRTWLGNARKFAGGRGSVARQAAPGRHGQGGSIASIVARRRAEGAV
ncbi:YdaU family protein [Frigidibacter sp. MR17.24]|uniref:YdaU family protein n=1 Tax=Frigidibacter sp. MR17.24 TaxID=3127345 RepID=UPI0030131147